MRASFARNLGYFWVGRFAGVLAYFATAFGAVLPTGEGLHAFSDVDEAAAAVERLSRIALRCGKRPKRSIV